MMVQGLWAYGTSKSINPAKRWIFPFPLQIMLARQNSIPIQTQLLPSLSKSSPENRAS